MAETPPDLRPQFPYTWVNKLDPVGERLIRVDSEAAMRLAERTTRLSDWGNDGIRQRIDAAVAGFQAKDLNTVGRFGARYVLHWHLANKLRLVEAQKRYPELSSIPIKQPIIITGFFRTGTTFLHSVLAADPNNRVGRAWELMYPNGRRHASMDDSTWRRRRARFTLGMNHSIIPDQDVAHHVVPESFEECLFLLQNEMASVTILTAFGTYSYGSEMLDWDMVPAYQSHKTQLQMLTAQRSATRWALKCPWHLWNLDALLAVYPDARIIQTHRNVAQALGSHASLCARMSSKVVRSVRLEELGDFWLHYSRAGLDRGLAVRDRLPDHQVYDLRLDDLLASPIVVLRDLYRHFELEFSDTLAQRFLSRIAEHPTSQLGEHDYDIDDYGLSEARVREVFSEYCERFRV